MGIAYRVIRNRASQGASVLLLILLAYAQTAFGQAQFRISPPVIELETGRGGTKVFSFELSNDDKERPVRFKLFAQDIEVDRDGNTQFLEAGKAARSCSGWITLEQRDVIIEPGKSKKITGKIRVPPSVAAGGYYSAIVCELQSASGPQSGSGALIHWRIASPVKVTILGGGIERKASLENFFLRTVFEKEPPRQDGLTFVAAFRNEGNIHLKAAGKLTVFTTEKTRKGEVVFDVGSGTVLPGSVREFSAFYNKFLTEGDYIARATFRYGGTATLEEEIPFSVRVASGEKSGETQAVMLPALKVIPQEFSLKIPRQGFRSAGLSIQNQKDEALKIGLAVEPETAGSAGWITIEPAEVTVEPGTETKAVLRISVPADAVEGEYKATLRLTPVSQGSPEAIEPLTLTIHLEVPTR